MGSNCIGLVHQTGLDWNEILISLYYHSLLARLFRICVHLDVSYCYLEVISLNLMIVKKDSCYVAWGNNTPGCVIYIRISTCDDCEKDLCQIIAQLMNTLKCHKDIQNPNPPLSNQPDRGRGQARLGTAGNPKSLNQDYKQFISRWLSEK